MPELPEVETLRRQLQVLLQGEKILRLEIFDAKLGTIEGLTGHRVEMVNRRGKYLQLFMSNGLTAEIHLRMSGRLFWQRGEVASPTRVGAVHPEKPKNRGEKAANSSCSIAYARLAITFPTGRLILIDPRRFAIFTVNPAERTAAVVEDPLEGLPPRRLQEIARTRRLPVKALLMDQRLIAGIGNIYACEILFAAGIDPRRSSSSLSPAEWRKVVKCARPILERAVACRGTTVSDWKDLFGCGGSNQDHLAVYGRQGDVCRRCGGQIGRIVQGGRGTWFCPSCQR